MKPTRLLVLIMLAVLALAADDKDSPKPSGKNQPLTLPKEAVRIEPFTYRYKDADGKTWIYRQTPFGLVRYDEEEAAARDDKKKETAVPLEVFDEGDRVRFERLGPFGTYRWFRKKTELTDEEREAWDRSRKKKEKTSTKSASQE